MVAIDVDQGGNTVLTGTLSQLGVGRQLEPTFWVFSFDKEVDEVVLGAGMAGDAR